MFKRVIARLDIKNNNLVKGVNLEGLRNLGDPKYFALKYYEEGIDELHYQDIVASLYDRNSIIEYISYAAKNVFVIISVGGGIRNNDDIDKVLRSGADKISMNSAAVKNPELIKIASNVYGSSTISVNIETIKTSSGYEVLIDSGRQKTGLDLNKWIEKIQKLGAGEIIITSISHEGKKKGFDINLYKMVKKYVSVPLIAHGGAGDIDHILELFQTCEVDGVALASILHYSYLEKNIKLDNQGKNYFINTEKEMHDDKKITINKIKKTLKKNGIKVRI